MHIELPPELAKLMQEKMAALGYTSRERLLGDALDALEAKGGLSGHDRPLPSSLPIIQLIQEALRHIPEEEFEKLPTDGASQHDHYIYGLPKHPE